MSIFINKYCFDANLSKEEVLNTLSKLTVLYFNKSKNKDKNLSNTLFVGKIENDEFSLIAIFVQKEISNLGSSFIPKIKGNVIMKDDETCTINYCVKWSFAYYFLLFLLILGTGDMIITKEIEGWQGVLFILLLFVIAIIFFLYASKKIRKKFASLFLKD